MHSSSIPLVFVLFLLLFWGFFCFVLFPENNISPIVPSGTTCQEWSPMTFWKARKKLEDRYCSYCTSDPIPYHNRLSLTEVVYFPFALSQSLNANHLRKINVYMRRNVLCCIQACYKLISDYFPSFILHSLTCISCSGNIGQLFGVFPCVLFFALSIIQDFHSLFSIG